MEIDAIYKMMLYVLDKPTEYRIVICTDAPVIEGACSDTLEALKNRETLDGLYYMIDRTSDIGETVANDWHVTTNCGGSAIIPTNGLLIRFIKQVLKACPNAKMMTDCY